MDSINEVILQGVIVHKFVADKVAILTINTGNSTAAINYPKVTFFGDLRDDIDINYKKGDHVTIGGNIQSSKPKENIKNQSLIAIFGEKIEKTQGLLESAFNISSEDSYKPYKNEIKIAGRVTYIESPAKGLIKLTVNTVKNNRQSFVILAYYTQDTDSVLEKIKRGDSVMAVGCVQTSKKYINGEVRHFENYVATEIMKSE